MKSLKTYLTRYSDYSAGFLVLDKELYVLSQIKSKIYNCILLR